ncbi:MAG: heavy-metal-associated domain-containing protein [Gemmatimonadetes bacterium]|nr:heavy-metal-associated domain-containing protein [Gemmatimonadota bacterium]
MTELDGVEKAEVSIDGQRVVVQFRPDLVDPAEMVEQVSAIGFPARLEGPADASSPSRVTEE